MVETVIRDKEWMDRTLENISREILSLATEEEILLAGIRTRGPAIAKLIADHITANSGRVCRTGAVDIRLQRDDFHLRGAVSGRGGTNLPVPIDEREVFLIDDVIYSGRTVRAALNELLDHGRASKVRLVTLIDRGERDFPIQPDIVGENIDAPSGKEIAVRLEGVDDGESRVLLL